MANKSITLKHSATLEVMVSESPSGLSLTAHVFRIHRQKGRTNVSSVAFSHEDMRNCRLFISTPDKGGNSLILGSGGAMHVQLTPAQADKVRALWPELPVQDNTKVTP